MTYVHKTMACTLTHSQPVSLASVNLFIKEAVLLGVKPEVRILLSLSPASRNMAVFVLMIVFQ